MGVLHRGKRMWLGFVYWDKRLWMGFCTGASASGWVSVLGQVPVGEFVYWGKRLWASMCTGASACGWLFVLAQAPVGGFVNWAKHLWIHAIPLADSESSMSRFPWAVVPVGCLRFQSRSWGWSVAGSKFRLISVSFCVCVCVNDGEGAVGSGGRGSYYHSLPSRDTQGINIYLLSHGHWGSNWFLASCRLHWLTSLTQWRVRTIRLRQSLISKMHSLKTGLVVRELCQPFFESDST